MLYLSFFIAILAFLIYNVNMQNSHMASVDSKILDYFHSIQSRSLDFFFTTFTWLGSLWLLLPLYVVFCIYLLNNDLKETILPLSVGFFGAIGTTYAIKYLQNRKRPDMFDTIGDMPFDPAFPSAHTTQVFIFVFLLSFLLFELDIQNKLLYIIVLLSTAIIVAASRIYLQVHYFTDVMAGLAVASIWIYIAIYLLKRNGGA